MSHDTMLIDESTSVVRNLMAPLKVSDDKKALYVSKMVDEIFLEAYVALCKDKGIEIEYGEADPLEIGAQEINELMASKFEFEDIVTSLGFATKILTLRYLEQADYSPGDLYGITKKFAHEVKEVKND